jgi:hypothetical protein
MIDYCKDTHRETSFEVGESVDFSCIASEILSRSERQSARHIRIRREPYEWMGQPWQPVVTVAGDWFLQVARLWAWYTSASKTVALMR